MAASIKELEEWAAARGYEVHTEARAGSDHLWIVTLKHVREPRKFSGSYGQSHVPPNIAYRNALGIAVGKAQAWEDRK